MPVVSGQPVLMPALPSTAAHGRRDQVVVTNSITCRCADLAKSAIWQRGDMASIDVRPVSEDEWVIVSWLWQCFRQDLAMIVSGLPYADGRYQTQGLPEHTSTDVAGYLAWRRHPKTGEAAPIGFALIDGLTRERRSIAALWVAPVVRREGVGRLLALDVIGRYVGPWSVAFQHDNVRAGEFWRRIADEAFGPSAWHEEERRVPEVPGAPPDHWIETI